MINRDLSIMYFFANVITLFPGMQWISLPEEVNVFGEMMHEQLDLRIEADNLAKFESNFAGRKLPVSFPRPLRIWSTPNMLVEEYENALPLELFLKNGGGPYNDTLAEVGLDAFLVCFLSLDFSSHLLMRLIPTYRTCYSWTTSYTPIYILATS